MLAGHTCSKYYCNMLSLIPKKSANCSNRSPKNSTSVNGFCRICKTNLKVEYGPAVSTENFFKGSNQKECKGLVLANACNSIYWIAFKKFSHIFTTNMSLVWKKNMQCSGKLYVTKTMPRKRKCLFEPEFKS